MRTIGVVTVGRSDYGILRPILKKIQADSDLKLALLVTGAHLSPGSMTLAAIKSDGFPILVTLGNPVQADTPAGVAKTIGAGVSGFAGVYANTPMDILLVLGDRFEMHAAALAALPFKIPVAHVHGGEVTEGAFDDALRHSMTKLSHLHFASTQQSAQRLIQMGEEPWRVMVSGAPGLDELRSARILRPEELEGQFGISLTPPPLLVTFHPVTLEYERTEWQTMQLLDAIRLTGIPAVFTLPNADTNNQAITRLVTEFVQTNRSARLVENFGTQAYFSMMAASAAMVGNSSSGIIEAASFKLPVVNIGTRQKGRLRVANVIDVAYDSAEIVQGIRKAVEPGFRASLKDLKNPYGNGNASAVIVDRLKSVSLDEKLIKKSFYDFPPLTNVAF
jgi:UDP-hydrolysing UDP-N-acetyl-D-glucosamine 2-epimerase